MELAKFVARHCTGNQYDSCIGTPCVWSGGSGCSHPLHPKNAQYSYERAILFIDRGRGESFRPEQWRCARAAAELAQVTACCLEGSEYPDWARLIADVRAAFRKTGPFRWTIGGVTEGAE